MERHVRAPFLSAVARPSVVLAVSLGGFGPRLICCASLRPFLRTCSLLSRVWRWDAPGPAALTLRSTIMVADWCLRRPGCILPLPPSETRTFVGLDDEYLESFCKAEGRANELRLDRCSAALCTCRVARRLLQTSMQSPRCRLVAGPSKEHHHQQQHYSPRLYSLGSTRSALWIFSRPPTPSTADSKVLRPSSAS